MSVFKQQTAEAIECLSEWHHYGHNFDVDLYPFNKKYKADNYKFL